MPRGNGYRGQIELMPGLLGAAARTTFLQGEGKANVAGSTLQYEFRVSGLIPADVLLELGEVEVSSQEPRTVLRGTFPDQAALYRFLRQLRGFGLEIVEVRRIHRGEEFGSDKPNHDEPTTGDV